MSGSDLSDSDKRAWRAVTRHIKPLKGRNMKPVVRGGAKQAELGLVSKGGEGKRRPPKTIPAPINRAGERQIRRGKQKIDARIDLHGMTQAQAWEALPQFLRRQKAKKARCVIVITGKGAGGQGVLRRNFLRWLELAEARTLVSGYAQAHAKDGGSGAFYVYLRKA